MPPPEAPDLDWTSHALVRFRQQKSRAAWLALRRVLEARAEPADPELADFLEGGRVVDAAGGAAEPVLEDPSFYCWVRIAHDLFTARRTGAAPPPLATAFARAAGAADADAAFRAALAAWRRFALAAAAAADKPLCFRAPLVLRERTPLPGHALVLEPSGAQAVRGWRDGAIERADGARLPLAPGGGLPGLALRACPVVRVGRLAVRMLPETVAVPGVFPELPAVAEQAAWRPLLERAFGVIARHLPGTFDEMAAAMRVVALKPYFSSNFVNQTHSHLPGAAVLSAVPHAFELADKLIHEWAHDRLFALEEGGPFLCDAVPAEALHYSPWRDDLRPLHGLVHAIYVHLHVWPLWERLAAADDVPEGLAELTRDRLIRYALQLRLGLCELSRHARFTARGEALVKELERRTCEIERACERLGLGPEVPARVVSLEGEVVPERGPAREPLSIGEALAWHWERASRGAA